MNNKINKKLTSLRIRFFNAKKVFLVLAIMLWLGSIALAGLLFAEKGDTNKVADNTRTTSSISDFVISDDNDGQVLAAETTSGDNQKQHSSATAGNTKSSPSQGSHNQLPANNSVVVPVDSISSPNYQDGTHKNGLFISLDKNQIYFGQNIHIEVRPAYGNKLISVDWESETGTFTQTTLSGDAASTLWTPAKNEAASYTINLKAITDLGETSSSAFVFVKRDPLYLEDLEEIKIRMGMNPDMTKFSARFTFLDSANSPINSQLSLSDDKDYTYRPEVRVYKEDGTKVYEKKYGLKEIMPWFNNSDDSIYFWYVEVNPNDFSLTDADFNLDYSFVRVKVEIKYKTMNQGEWSQNVVMEYNKNLGSATWDYGE